MSGHNAFEQMVEFTERSGKPKPRAFVTRAEFEEWKRVAVVDIMKGLRYGQSFCNRMGIGDYILYHNTWDVEQMNDYIERNYIEKP